MPPPASYKPVVFRSGGGGWMDSRCCVWSGEGLQGGEAADQVVYALLHVFE